MAIVIKLRKGLDINLKGKAAIKKVKGATATEYALEPDAFPGLTPKVVVKEGEHVLAGDPLLVNKQCPDVKFASPVSGTVKAVIRGERRRVLRVVVEADKEQQARDFGKRDAGALDGQGVIDTLCEAGLFGYINQLPYAVSTTPDQKPKGIFVSALRDMPLAGDFEVELEGNEEAFLTGLTALQRIAPVHLGIG